MASRVPIARVHTIGMSAYGDNEIRDILELSSPETGKIFGKHHSTAMYAVDIIQKMRQSNPDFDATLTAFRDHFG